MSIRSLAAAMFAMTALMLAMPEAGSPTKAHAADIGACTQSCHAAHNQCRIATKGAASCDGQLQACLRGCLSAK